MYLNRYCKCVKNLCELGILYVHIYGNNTHLQIAKLTN